MDGHAAPARIRRGALAAVILSFVLAVAGCYGGGGNKPGKTGGTTTSGGGY
jgi:hypothetical protein